MNYSKLTSYFKFPYRDDPVFAALFFAVVFVPLVFVNYLFDQVETPKLALWGICMAVAAIVWVRRAEPAKYNKGLAVSVVIFVLLAVVSTFVSFDRLNSIFGLYGRLTSSILFYGLWGATLLLMVTNLTREKFIFLCKTLVFTSALIAIFGIVQNMGFGYYEGLNTSVRPMVPSFLGNPNFSAMFIASVLPLALLFFSQAVSAAGKIYYASTAILIIFGLALFGSRGSLGAVLAALAIMALFGIIMRMNRWFVVATAAAIGGMILLGGIFLNVTRPEVVGETLSLSENTVQLRFQAWDVSLDIIKHYPWLGTGPGNYFIGFNKFASAVFTNSERFDDAHNLVLHIAATGGIPAAIVFLVIILIAGIAGWRTFWRTRDPLYLVILASTAAWLVSSSFNPVVTGCWLLLALLLSGLVLSETTEKALALPRYAAPVVVIGGVIFMAGLLSFVASDAFAYNAITSYAERNYARSERSARFASYLNPTNSTVSAFWAVSRIRMQRSPEITDKIIRRLVTLHSESFRTQNVIATLYYLLYKQTNDKQYLAQVPPHLDNSIKLESHISSLDGRTAYIYYKIGDLDKALYYLRQTLILEPKQLYAWVLMAQIQKEKGNREQMIKDLEQGQKLDPKLTLLEKVIEQAKSQSDLSKINFPVAFPDPDLQI